MKKKDRNPSLKEKLDAACAAYGMLCAHVTELQAQRAKLLVESSDNAEVAAIDDQIAGKRREADIERDRIGALEASIEEERKQRQAEAHEELIVRIEKLLEQRDAAGLRLAALLSEVVSVYRETQSYGAQVRAAWPFSTPDNMAALTLTRPLRLAVQHELYRISASPYETLETSLDREPEFPGARAPSLTDPRISSVKPLADVLQEASAYAVRSMRNLPPPEPAVPSSVLPPKCVDTTPDAPLPPIGTQTDADRPLPVYEFAVDFLHRESSETRTETVHLPPEQVEEAFLRDPSVGATGKAGKDIALRLATERVAAGFLFAGHPGAIRFNGSKFAASIEGANA